MGIRAFSAWVAALSAGVGSLRTASMPTTFGILAVCGCLVAAKKLALRILKLRFPDLYHLVRACEPLVLKLQQSSHSNVENFFISCNACYDCVGDRHIMQGIISFLRPKPVSLHSEYFNEYIEIAW